MEFMDSSMTFRQKNLVIKSLRYMDRHKKITQYCDECGKSWTDLSFDEANNLTKILDKMAWK
ncbi:hypothetical protein FTO70_13585 [Methanosarcina sp. KYL-1]|uniref:hypothetical protein n=1 Tax=Methanosarcina sp. KYL-1 TaxID=2602068 RepID=UPI002101A1E5|nr:hypothetical protein [Methanosarcina sp. KYL-1]MCQ1536680.1 hypothetical protein [Methanosarcina sp. KYL-1]